MYFYELFSHADRFSYRAHIISSSTCAIILCTALTFLSPFLLTYYTGDFWTKESVYSEQPYLDNNTKSILIAQNNGPDNEFFYSSDSTLNQNFYSNLIPATTTTASYDIDGDGLIDQFSISFDLIFSSPSTVITNINIWLIFQYQLSKKQLINMETMALISIIPPSSISTNSNLNITVYGQLLFQQQQGIQRAGNDSTYNQSIIDVENLSSSPDLNAILDDYFTRKYYTTYETQYTWITPRTTPTDTSKLTVTVVVNNGRQAIRYVPGFWQDFKWGWIQYISVLFPFMIVFNRLKLFVFSNHLVRTFVPLTTHRYKA
jgi:hypothetical protein